MSHGQANFGLIFAVFGILVALLTYADKALSPKLRLGFIYSGFAVVLHFVDIIPRAALILAF